MSRLIESIKVLNGALLNLSYHEERMQWSLSQLFNRKEPVNLSTLIEREGIPPKGCYKCRVEYDDAFAAVSFTPYEVRPVRTVKIVEDDEISYAYKFADRSVINRLFDMRGDCDDVLIVRRGLVTDCSYSNVVFRKGDDWYTPDTPLLEGTMRAKLIRENRISVREIRKENVRSFDSLKIINAMLEFEGPEIDVSDIVF